MRLFGTELSLIGCALSQECPDFDLSYECSNHCSEIRSNCLESCQESRECQFSCDYSAAECTNSCPCFKDCPTGCGECVSDFCACKDYENNENYKECKKQRERDYDKCLLSCEPGDFSCLAVCSRELNNALETCPCQSDCPHGCPCPNFECPYEPTTTVSPTQEPEIRSTVLVLNTYTDAAGYRNRALLVDSNGKHEEQLYFIYGAETTVKHSCSLVWNNQFYVFGGDSEFKRQVSRLDGCKLTRVSSLSFNFEHGACTSVGDRRFYLCFGMGEDIKTCRYATEVGQEMIEAAESLFTHHQIRIASSDNEILAVGSLKFTTPEAHNKSEVLRAVQNYWLPVNDYPYTGMSDLYKDLSSSCKSVRGYSIIYFNDGWLLFGGFIPPTVDTIQNSNVIARLDAGTYSWSQVGELLIARRAHNTIYDGSKFLIIGGIVGQTADDVETEQCQFIDNEISCVLQNPVLNNYQYYPELYLVPADFCQ